MPTRTPHWSSTARPSSVPTATVAITRTISTALRAISVKKVRLKDWLPVSASGCESSGIAWTTAAGSSMP